MKSSLKLILFLGIVSLWADFTYEGARSITGPFLAILGASGTAVGVIAGFGEFAGYGIRLLSGMLSERFKALWPFMFFGYFINLFAVPLLACAGSWQLAALLIILERIGKGIRIPARDTMLSYASKEIGRGKGFGIHEIFDQCGALLGPLVVSLALFENGGYRLAFLLLGIPAILAYLFLIKVRLSFPRPEELEPAHSQVHAQGLGAPFWKYLLATGCVAAGYADFALIAYHFVLAKTIPSTVIPLFYAMAMGIGGLSAYILGRCFDRWGLGVLLGSVFASSLFAPFVFFGGGVGSFIGMILWGIGIGAQGSILKAIIPHLVSPEKRVSAYGLFGLSFGLFWFAGSALLGYLYDISLVALCLFSILVQWLSIFLFIRNRKSLAS